jgi:hypothetical protein
VRSSGTAKAASTKSATPAIAMIVVVFDDDPGWLGGGSGRTMGAARARVGGGVATGFVVVEVVVVGVVVVVVVVVDVVAVVVVVVDLGVVGAPGHGTIRPAPSKQTGAPNAGGTARVNTINIIVAIRIIATGRRVASLANGERRRPEPAMQTPLRAGANGQASAGRAFQFAAPGARKWAW